MQVFVARQPILDAEGRTTAYELLFRGDRDALESGILDQATAGDAATSQVIVGGTSAIGLDALCPGVPAFINFTRNHLLADTALLLPPGRVVIEILEGIEPDEPVVEAARRAREAGHVLALDDFAYDPRWEPLLAMADFVKVDVLASDPAEEAERIRAALPGGRAPLLLAEKVEDEATFRRCRDLGYARFQGWYFARPETLSGEAPAAWSGHVLALLRETRTPEPDTAAIAAILGRDPGLAWRFLRFANAPIFPWSGRVRGPRHALGLLGTRLLRQWAGLVALAALSEDAPPELVNLAVTRAIFLESLADDLRRPPDELHLLGLMSLVEAMARAPTEKLLDGLPLSPELEAALLRREGPLAPLLDLCVAFERGDWAAADRLSTDLGLGERAARAMLEATARAPALVLAVDGTRGRQAS